MKIQNLLIFFLLFQVGLTTLLKKFQLEIKNGLEAEADIVLIPGIFTKVTLSLKSLDGDDFTFKEDDEKTGYKISFNDENIVSLAPVVTMIPQENLVYTNYIGISCSNLLKDDSYDIPIKVELLNEKTDEGSIVYEDKLHVKINRVKVDIKLDLLLNSMAQKSQNFFQLENELYNVDEINISLDDQNSLSNKFEFNALSIASFAKRKNNKELEEISKDNPANHGILFNCPFFPKDILASAKFNFNLKIDGETNGLCFNLFKKEFNFELKTEGVIDLDAEVKTAITYNTDDDTPLYDASNKIKLHTYIPLAPVILECKFYLDSSLVVGNDVENQASAQASLNYEHIFKTVVKSEGKFDINLLNLNASAEYYARCDISNVGVKDVVKKIKLLIGKFDGADIIKQLVPSRDPNATPQCVTFTFDNILQSAAFFKLGPLYCSYFMKKKDALIARALPTVICNSVSLSGKDTTLCVAPSPLYNTGRFLSKKETDFNQRFDEFVKKIANFDLSEYGLGSIILKVKNYVREYDNVSIDPNSISVSLKKVNAINIIHPFTFEIKSTHPQNVECFYNAVLTGEKSIFLKYLKNRVVLAPNETKEIGVSKLFTFLKKDDKLYSLNLRCYNLPGFLFKYESTGVMNKFTYCNCKDSIEQTTDLVEYKPINCNEKKYKRHPRCLKVKLISIFEQIRTRIPKRIKEIELDIQQFVSAAISFKINFLKKLVSDFKNCLNNKKNNLKEVIEKAIELLKYSSNTDCSVNTVGLLDENSDPIKQEQYSECRKTKQTIIGQLLSLIKDKLECPSLIALITTVENSITEDLEENIKYILFLLNELSNNPESFTQETSVIIYDLVQCIQYQFDKYWPLIEAHLKKKKCLLATILAVKKDIAVLILQTLQNLGKVINFGQLDGYIAAKKNEITKTGLIICDKAREIQANILLFAKKLLHFGPAKYSFSGSMFAYIDMKEGISAGAETDTKISLVKDKDIAIVTNSSFLLNKEGAYALKTLAFDSPLVSVKASAEGEVTSNTVNTLVSINLYDKDGNEITLKDIKEAFRPQILYLKEKYSHLKYCYYYDEFKNELVTEGLTPETVTFNGKVYLKCSTPHLGIFTAGSVESKKEA